jgi:N-methylhydantoinase B
MLQLIRLLPEEPVTFEDVLDSDGVSDEPLVIRATLRRRGDRVSLDYTGSSPQCAGPMNFPVNRGLAKMGLYNTLRIVAGHRINIDPQLDANQGVDDLVDIRVPDDCFLNPQRPAPVSLRHLTMGRMIDVSQGIMAQIFPDTVTAPSNGSLNCCSLLGWGREPEDRWLFFEVAAAGGGGRPFTDGIDAYCWNNRLKNAPVEFVETVYPVRVEQYSLRPGSAGAGLHRGGYGLMRAIRTLRHARLTFLDERQRSQPWGLRGGRAAAANDAYVERADGTLEMVSGKLAHLPMAPGDMFVMRTGGGGGWGNPFERDPELVCRDVRNGLLTVAQARDWYGVVVHGDPPAIDPAATERLRAAPRASQSWIDRGSPIPAPGPGECWTLEALPQPWLVVERRVAARRLAAADD